MLTFYRRSEGTDVSTYRVESEVAVACARFDLNKDGRIQFSEFVEMFAHGAPFRCRRFTVSVLTSLSPRPERCAEGRPAQVPLDRQVCHERGPRPL